ncbi:hypothetical protein JW887_02160 [Candidatus Dojkabacteria bacterium]|nr:hypothetical protein [Candidatus Dojkabacteria bacterium]
MSDENFFQLSWNDYGLLIEDLWKDLEAKIKKHNVKIDAIIGILREGMFTAMPLAYKLNTYKVLTIQFKYMLYNGSNELKYISGLQDVEYDLPQNPTFLLCDTFPCGGKTKFLALEKIREKYSSEKFIFASLVQDLSVKNHKDFLFDAFAFDINEKWETSHPLFKKYGIDKNALNVLLPWENSGEEVASVVKKEWKYN